MAGFSDTFENDVCKLIFNAVAIGNIADNAASSPLTNLWCALHTADPADPVANIDFPQNTSTSTGTFTHASIGVTSASTGAKIIAAGTISPNINFSQNVTPRLTTASSFTLD